MSGVTFLGLSVFLVLVFANVSALWYSLQRYPFDNILRKIVWIVLITPNPLTYSGEIKSSCS